ncbi:MAG: hypothetical protein HRU17_19085 [Polyangiaceae bacterium]|nr:hypothetical protein [Polyangiaceae bacterium]
MPLETWNSLAAESQSPVCGSVPGNFSGDPMRSYSLPLIGLLLLTACGSSDESVGNAAENTNNSTDAGSTNTGPVVEVCEADETQSCLGEAGCVGSQTCVDNLSAYSACDCGSDSSGSIAGTSQDANCDMNGYWAVRKLSLPQDTAIGSTQPASAWYYFRIEQNGADFTILDSLDCGTEASGNATVVLTTQTLLGLMTKNNQRGRTGTFAANVDHCEFSIRRQYNRLGMAASVLPEQGSQTELAEGLEDRIEEAEDWDGSGYGGIAYNTSGIITGVRHAIQINWDSYFNDADFGHMPGLGADEFTLRMEYSIAEAVTGTECGRLGLSCQLLLGKAIVIPQADNAASFHLLGRTFEEATASDVLDPSSPLNTCYNIQDTFPHADSI